MFSYVIFTTNGPFLFDNMFCLLIYNIFYQDTALDKAKLPVPEPSDAERASLVNFDDIANDLKKLYTQIKSWYFLFLYFICLV